MPARKQRPASRGFVNNIILESLISGDKYGYEIIKIVEEKSNGKIILKQPSLYSSLKRFETKGFITSYWGDSDIGGRRHYYTITETGKNHYNKNVLKIDADLDDDDYFNDDDNEELPESNEQLELEVESTPAPPPVKKVSVNVDDEDYNVFDLLENQNDDYIEEKSTKQKTTTTETVQEQPVLVKEEPVAVEPEKEIVEEPPKQVKEKVNTIQVDMFSKNEEIVKNEKIEQIDIESIYQIKETDSNLEKELSTPQPETKKDIPLIEEENQDYFNWEKSEQTKSNNNDVANELPTNEPEKPLKNQIYIDEYGIIKVGEPTEEKPVVKKIFDNVGDRIEYNDPVVKPKQQTTKEELTDEQREQRNKQFTQKLDKIISEKTNTDQDDVDYKNILGELLADEEPEKTEPTISENNYVKQSQEISDETIEKAIVNVEQNNLTTNTYNNNGFKFKPYSPASLDEKEENKTDFILINKARLHFGLFISILMILQISVLFITLKCCNLLAGSDYTLFAVFYGVAILILLLLIIPYFIAPEKRSENNFRFNYTLIFCVLLFLAGCALTYAGCTFAGLNNNNVSMFAARLLLPIILCTNFIISPIVYKMVLNDKKLY